MSGEQGEQGALTTSCALPMRTRTCCRRIRETSWVLVRPARLTGTGMPVISNTSASGLTTLPSVASSERASSAASWAPSARRCAIRSSAASLLASTTPWPWIALGGYLLFVTGRRLLEIHASQRICSGAARRVRSALAPRECGARSANPYEVGRRAPSTSASCTPGARAGLPRSSERGRHRGARGPPPRAHQRPSPRC